MPRKKPSKNKKSSSIKRILISILIIVFIYHSWSILLSTNLEKNFSKDKIQNTFLEKNQEASSEVSTNQESNHSNNSEEDTIQKLQTLSTKDERINTILENRNEYPEELLDMLSRNVEMVDFVLDFPEKKGQVFSDNIENVKEGTFPLLLQWDPRWGYASYGENYLAISGCAPTALAMVVAGLTGKNSITPYTISSYAEESGYYKNGVGTSWNLMTEGSKHFGVKGTEIPLSKSAIYQSLESGYPIICSMRPGDFTTQGHFIVLTSLKNGKIKVNDPNSKKRSNQLWDYDTLEYQIKNLWSFQPL